MWSGHKLYLLFHKIILNKVEKTLNIKVHPKCAFLSGLYIFFIYVDLDFHYALWISGRGSCSPFLCALVIEVQMADL